MPTDDYSYDGNKTTIGTSRNDWQMGFSTVAGSTYSTAFAQKALTSTTPATNATNGSFVVPACDDNFLMVRPFGADADGETFAIQVWGWSQLDIVGSSVKWVPQLIATIDCTLGSTVTGLGSDTFWADTLAEVTDMAFGSSGVTLLQPSAADNTPVAFVVDYTGFQLIEIQTSISGDTGESVNFLWRTF